MKPHLPQGEFEMKRQPLLLDPMVNGEYPFKWKGYVDVAETFRRVRAELEKQKSSKPKKAKQ
jgi:hypothetical protein